MALKKNTQSKVFSINSNGAKAIEELERRKRWHEEDKQEADWLPSDVELAGKIHAIIHAADKYRDLIEARPFEIDHPETGADSVLWAGVQLCALTRLLDSSIEGFSRRAHKAAEEKQCGCGDDFGNALTAAEFAGFKIGIIFGARMAGYSRAQIKKVGRGLFKAMTGKHKYRRRGLV